MLSIVLRSYLWCICSDMYRMGGRSPADLREILLVVVVAMKGLATENTALRLQVDQFGRLPVDVEQEPSVDHHW